MELYQTTIPFNGQRRVQSNYFFKTIVLLIMGFANANNSITDCVLNITFTLRSHTCWFLLLFTAASRKSPYPLYRGVATYRIVFERSRFYASKKIYAGSRLICRQQRRVDPHIFYGVESLFDYSSCRLKRKVWWYIFEVVLLRFRV